MAESKLQSQMGSWDEGWGGECVGGWVRVKDVLSLFKGRISSQASVLLQRADMRMRKVGVIFLACCLFCFFFVTIQIQKRPTTEIREGQTNRLTYGDTYIDRQNLKTVRNTTKLKCCI